MINLLLSHFFCVLGYTKIAFLDMIKVTKLNQKGALFMYQNYNMNQVVLPLDLEVKIPENDLVKAVNALVESIPDDLFYLVEKRTGRPAYHPKMMMKVLLYAYSQSVFSGRKIERLMSDSIRMMWLSNHEVVSYRTINRFRVEPTTAVLLEECFIQFRCQLVRAQLIDDEAIYIDGTKLEADANKFSFVWKKATEKYERSLKEKSQQFYEELYQADILPCLKEESDEIGLTATQLTEARDYLTDEITEMTAKIDQTADKATASHLKKKRRTAKKHLRKISEDFLPRRQKYDTHFATFGTRNSFSKTDNDATFMRMKDDYMKNGQLKPGYNLQIATENQFTLAYKLYPNPTDTRTLPDFLATYNKLHQELPDYIVADAGYGSEANYQHIIDELNRIPLITYGSYYRDKKKKQKKKPFVSDNWVYVETDDLYICPAKRPVAFKRYSTRKDTYGYERHVKVYECEDCRECELRSLCTKAKSNHKRQIHLNPTWEYFKHYTKDKLSNERTKEIYKQRKVDVEPVFGNLKANLGVTRFHVRGHHQVTNEIGFALMALNLKKLAINWPNQLNGQKISWRLSVILIVTKIFFCFKGVLSQPLFGYRNSSIGISPFLMV